MTTSYTLAFFQSTHWTPNIEHLYSPRMVEEIKEEEKMKHQTNKQ